ncbi:NAD-dependent epimerase/dehydratase family protein [Aliarcobacter cryaerophilus]|uniref:NAD-dependent epimerase/dehydratase family protein n=1 Tax=Aliarcobacter cryaerophilus TaxID=28198 RepID=UPI0021B335F7|nr:NAD-dependent epimerase/dehydratase family protein [Aliarcobacter cryaerophilus]MCT7468641.1 NAD-dependent epimerase/dehydratase family protein [Aliarcobacter cryaerophilus]
MKKLLITGSNGFIGNYFINKYKGKYDIKAFSFLKDDINSLDCSDIDAVFHLSALVHQMGGASCEEYERVNVSQTLQLAKKAKESGVKQFIFMSTVAVYGIETGVMNEKSDYTPLTEYGKSKLRAEIELQKLDNKNFKVSIIRPPIVYGKNAPGNMKSLLKLINKVPLLPFGKIENKRSTDELKSKINFHISDDDFKSANQRKIPYLLFAKPNDNSFRLFAYGEVGLEILEKIKEIFPNEFYLKEQKFTVQKLVLNEPAEVP